MAVAGGDEKSLAYTPTWVVALVCFSIVFISITVDRFFRRAGQFLRKKKSWLFMGASRKIKDELMLLGIISLLLAVVQSSIGKICISEKLNDNWLPCKKPDSSSTVASFSTSSVASNGTRGRRLLAMASATTDYCSKKGKVPLLSVEAVHHLHIFIFVLAIFHVILCLLKVLSMMNQWRHLKRYDRAFQASNDLPELVVKVRDFYGQLCGVFRFLVLVIEKGITSMSQFEYIALAVNFTGACDRKATGEDFQKHIMSTLQMEFEKMIGISWYLWLLAVIYLLVNVAGWHAYFWISFMPLILWLTVHFKLEGMMRGLTNAVAEKHAQYDKESSGSDAKQKVVEISNRNFWFRRPHLVGNLIHIVLFENSLELTFFFFILFQYGFHSCIMGKVGFVIPRILIGVIVQLLCMSRTLPLYAVMISQMHLNEKQSDKQNKMCPETEKITRLLKENQSRIKECLDGLYEIEIRLKENEMHEEEDMTRNLEGIDKRKKPRSTEVATDTESTRTGSREGSVGAEITESGDMNSRGDIEAQTTKPAPTLKTNEIVK